MVITAGKENDLYSSVLNGYMWGKISFVKARKKDVAVIKMQDERCLDESFSCLDREERLRFRCYAERNDKIWT